MRRSTLVLAAVVALGVYGCGSDEESSDERTTTAVETQQEDLDANEVGELLAEEVKFEIPFDYLQVVDDGGEVESSSAGSLDGKVDVRIEEYVSSFEALAHEEVVDRQGHASPFQCGNYLVNVYKASPDGGIRDADTDKGAEEIAAALEKLEEQIGSC
jgi:hypothetical protein